MNMKFGLVAGAAIACAVMSGCKAPKAQAPSGTTVEPVSPVQKIEVATVTEAPKHTVKTHPEAPRCKCAPGTVHDVPCACGGSNCKCKVKAPEPEYTVYRVKGGDMLSSICKTYGLKQKKVLELNPGLEANKLYAGRKIKLPGKIELKGDDAANVASAPGEKAAPSVKAAAVKPAAKSAARVSSYKGATKEYVVKNGDFLGKIAAEFGITVKCLKELNGLKANNIRVGQKLKVPAEKQVAEAKPAPAPAPAKQEAALAAKSEAPAEAKPEAAAASVPEAAPAVETVPSSSDAKPATDAAPTAVEQVQATTAALESSANEAKTHTVKENEDIVSIAIMYNVSPSAIMDLNDLKNTDTLVPGRVLKLPANAKVQ